MTVLWRSVCGAFVDALCCLVALPVLWPRCACAVLVLRPCAVTVL